MVSQIAHLPAISFVPRLKLCAVADINQVLAAAVAPRFGGRASIYSTHKALLGDERVSAAVVVSNRHRTAAIVRDVLASKRHVLSEKPMAMTLPVARELVAVAKRNGVVYGVGFMKRYDAGVARGKSLLGELLASRRLGRLICIRGKNFCSEYVGNCEDYVRSEPPAAALPAITNPTSPDWLDPGLARKYDWFANVGLHTINLLRYLLDGDLSVRHANFAYDLAATVELDAVGVPISLDLGKAGTGRWEESFEFFFERGRLKLQLTSLKQRDRCAAVTLDENAGAAKSSHWGHDTPGTWSFARQMEAFAEAIAGRPEALLATGEDSLKDMELLEDIFKCAQGTKHG